MPADVTINENTDSQLNRYNLILNIYKIKKKEFYSSPLVIIVS